MEEKTIALNISGGNIDEKSAGIATAEIVKILDASLGHRDSNVTIAALEAATKMIRPSADYMTITDCQFNMGDPGNVEVEKNTDIDPEE